MRIAVLNGSIYTLIFFVAFFVCPNFIGFSFAKSQLIFPSLQNKDTPEEQILIELSRSSTLLKVNQYYLKKDDQSSLGCGPNALLMFYNYYRDFLKDDFFDNKPLKDRHSQLPQPNAPDPEAIDKLSQSTFKPWEKLFGTHSQFSGTPMFPHNLYQAIQEDFLASKAQALRVHTVSKLLSFAKFFNYPKLLGSKNIENTIELKKFIKSQLDQQQLLITLLSIPKCLDYEEKEKLIFHYAIIVGYVERKLIKIHKNILHETIQKESRGVFLNAGLSSSEQEKQIDKIYLGLLKQNLTEGNWWNPQEFKLAQTILERVKKQLLASEKVKTQMDLLINNGWQNWRIDTDLDSSKLLKMYTRMSEKLAENDSAAVFIGSNHCNFREDQLFRKIYLLFSFEP